MLWEVNIFAAPGLPDVIATEVLADASDLGFSATLAISGARGYLFEGDLKREQVELLASKLLADSVVERTTIGRVGDDELAQSLHGAPGKVVYVLPKPGVTDVVADSARKSATDFGIQPDAVRTFKKYWISGIDDAELERLASKLLSNDAIEQVAFDKLDFDSLQVGSPYEFKLLKFPIRAMNDDELMTLSKEGHLYLSLEEMQTIKAHFCDLDRDPTDVELETIAQTWSEHCSHKTLAGRIAYEGPEGKIQFENMLKETVFASTVKIRENLGDDDFCVSVFSDNAGVVKFDDEYNVCFKAETHNHPSALEPYGGANTGIGGVIRDTMGTGLGAKPVCSTGVFCFAPPNLAPEEVPGGVLHPRRVIKGVVAGARDYGNLMGIPTVNGSVYFDKRYLANPLVYCGNVGLIPVDKSFKEPKPNDLIVVIGARTGRDGIHGATFSSAELTSESETIAGGAVQIGNAIVEKAVLDVMIEARDRGLYNAVTDCGAGGFSSAVGEMGEDIGVEVNLDVAPLKYEGLSYDEIWISEAQERMVLAVPEDKWPEFKALADSEDVETFVLGVFKPTGRLILKYGGQTVGDLDMKFMHKGRPRVNRRAVYNVPELLPVSVKPANVELWAQTSVSRALESCSSCKKGKTDATLDLEAILASLNVASKHWVIRQCDDEVQGGNVLKSLVGVENDGPGDAAVLRPRIQSRRGLVISNGMNPNYGDYDTYWMAASAIDEAIRNAVAVGANPATITLLDNFCWGNTDRPEVLGSLVRAALACYDVATAMGTPFISGKDSLYNEFRPEGKESIAIPPSLLISAMGQVDNVDKCVSMDLKESGNALYLVGTTKNELGGSHLSLVRNWIGGQTPTLDVALAKRVYDAVYNAIQSGLIRSIHDLSEGGLAVAVAESAFAGGLGAEVSLAAIPSAKSENDTLNALPGVADEQVDDYLKLFSESNTRLLIEVSVARSRAFEAALDSADVPFSRIGKVVENPRLTIAAGDGSAIVDADLADLKRCWQKPLDFGGEYSD
ncbi:MAG: phosphoribosylformylglycinamidine synthase subunit PurL [Thermoguttaceae bacterium]|jgi:phosphoribosylformylglycinamidine synthase II